MTTRRELLIVLGAGAFAYACSTFAQSRKLPILIGWLSMTSREADARGLTAFKEGLAALGWKEGSQFVMEERWADGRIERLQPLADELAARRPALIVTVLVRATAAAAKAAPGIPVVQANGGSPITAGVAKSLARPGGMVTGITNLVGAVSEKYVELLLAAAPKLKRIGLLVDTSTLAGGGNIKLALRAAGHYGIEARLAEAGNAAEIESAILHLAKEGVQGLVVLPSAGLFTIEAHRIARLALAQRWPLSSGNPALVEAGGLVSYFADIAENYRRAAYYVDRILRGTKPGDLPIEQPTKLQVVLNLKTAKLLKLEIPRELAVRADRVIE